VKSSVNQPVMLVPSIDLVVWRAAKFGVVRDVGCRTDLVLVPCHEDVILGGDQVGLDDVSAHAYGQVVAGQRVLGAIAGRAAVTEDQRRDLAALCRAVRSVGRAGQLDARSAVNRSRENNQCQQQGDQRDADASERSMHELAFQSPNCHHSRRVRPAGNLQAKSRRSLSRARCLIVPCSA
jgi:hypothetical protein